jgi:tryptophan synthase alpha chain
MSRLAARFQSLARQGDGALIVFLVAGHPDPQRCSDLLLAVADAGADVIELGVPFSDPLADGAVIQAASQRALAEDVTPAGVLEMAAALRAKRDLPLVLMTCYNPIWQFGVEEFAQRARAKGVDGVIATDLPPEEAEEWVRVARSSELDTIFLLAPTSPAERVKKVVDLASGFVYCVSRMGVTGARDELPLDLGALVQRIRRHTEKPVAVGFGISRPEHVAEVCGIADGAVVGSAVVSLIEREQDSAGLAVQVKDFVGQLKAATLRRRPVGEA